MSGLNLANFLPYETIALSATNANSVSGKWTSQGSILDMSDCCIYNETAVTAYVGFYNSKNGAVTHNATVPTSTPTQYCYPIGAGETQVLNKNAQAGAGGADTCVVILAGSGTGNVYFTSGRGS